MYFSKEARELLAKGCLIAADVDKTLLEQGSRYERDNFMRFVAPRLIDAARLGVNIASITGNSMHALCSRFLKLLVDHLCHNHEARLLKRFHFFCNSGGVYAHVDTEGWREEITPEEVMDVLTEKIGDETFFRPNFIDAEYIQKNSIPDSDREKLVRLLEEARRYYDGLVAQQKEEIKRDYAVEFTDGGMVSHFDDSPMPMYPVFVENRMVRYEKDRPAYIQMTMKPVLSFRHARKKEAMLGKDIRSRVVDFLQSRLDASGLHKYVAKPGGISSIDLTLEKLDKAYALEFLIDRLNIKGIDRLGKKTGSNAMYFGDEVIVGGGNDYPVTRIPGLLVFAVNTEKKLIPFLNGVVADYDFVGPGATGHIIGDFVHTASEVLQRYDNEAGKGGNLPHKNVMEAYKTKYFIAGIRKKLFHLESKNLSAEDLNMIHTLISLICRDDYSGKKWVSVLINELDQIMTHIQHPNQSAAVMAIGTSHPDGKTATMV